MPARLMPRSFASRTTCRSRSTSAVENSRVLPADRAAFDPTKVIAAPGGPRADLFASHGVADMDGDGRLMATDLQQYLRSLRSDSRQVELQERLLRLGPVTPG